MPTDALLALLEILDRLRPADDSTPDDDWDGRARKELLAGAAARVWRD